MENVNLSLLYENKTYKCFTPHFVFGSRDILWGSLRFVHASFFLWQFYSGYMYVYSCVFDSFDFIVLCIFYLLPGSLRGCVWEDETVIIIRSWFLQHIHFIGLTCLICIISTCTLNNSFFLLHNHGLLLIYDVSTLAVCFFSMCLVEMIARMLWTPHLLCACSQVLSKPWLN